jgi:hypothetical protein
MMADKPNLNEGKPWSEMDLFDLKGSIAQNTPVAEIADFLCRGEKEVGEKRRGNSISTCFRVPILWLASSWLCHRVSTWPKSGLVRLFSPVQ